MYILEVWSTNFAFERKQNCSIMSAAFWKTVVLRLSLRAVYTGAFLQEICWIVLKKWC